MSCCWCSVPKHSNYFRLNRLHFLNLAKIRKNIDPISGLWTNQETRTTCKFVIRSSYPRQKKTFSEIGKRAKKTKEENVQEKSKMNVLLEELEIQFQNAQEIIEALDNENKELWEKKTQMHNNSITWFFLLIPSAYVFFGLWVRTKSWAFICWKKRNWWEAVRNHCLSNWDLLGILACWG